MILLVFWQIFHVISVTFVSKVILDCYRQDVTLRKDVVNLHYTTYSIIAWPNLSVLLLFLANTVSCANKFRYPSFGLPKLTNLSPWK